VPRLAARRISSSSVGSLTLRVRSRGRGRTRRCNGANRAADGPTRDAARCARGLCHAGLCCIARARLLKRVRVVVVAAPRDCLAGAGRRPIATNPTAPSVVCEKGMERVRERCTIGSRRAEDSSVHREFGPNMARWCGLGVHRTETQRSAASSDVAPSQLRGGSVSSRGPRPSAPEHGGEVRKGGKSNLAEHSGGTTVCFHRGGHGHVP
jgi:hypothetical protein